MPSSTVSPRSAILCAGSDASFLKVSRTPYLSTVNSVFDERTCMRMREQPCLTLSKTTARRNLLVSSAVSRSSRSALRKPRSITILYCIVRRAPCGVLPFLPPWQLGFDLSPQAPAHGSSIILRRCVDSRHRTHCRKSLTGSEPELDFTSTTHGQIVRRH